MQLVEAAALWLFSDGGPLTQLRNEVRIPQVLSHDATSFVLGLEDLGPLLTLWELLLPSTLARAGINQDLLLTRCADIARRIGILFAQLHSSESAEKIRFSGFEAVLSLLERSTSKSVIYEAAVQPVLLRLQEQGGLDTATAHRLYARVEQDFERKAYAGEPSLSMGDFHPGCILVSPLQDWPDDAASGVDVGVIDWEFTKLNGRGISGDIPQLLASLHCQLLSLAEGSPAYEATLCFARTVCTAYASQAQLAAKTVDRSARNPMMGICRSALILLGRETINQAIDRQWESGGTSVKEMVQAGAWYIERAGEDVQDMLQEDNWNDLLRERFPFISLLFCLRPGPGEV